MSFQAQPTVAGTYRVKQYYSSGYWKYISDGKRWIQFDSLDENSDLFKWHLTPVSGHSVFTIRPASDTTVGFIQSVNTEDYQSYYGFAEGHVGPSANWRFTKSSHGKYSSIKIDGSANVLDSCNNPEHCVHFYQDQNVNTQQWVFELLPVALAVREKTFEAQWFQLTPEKAATETYDIIVIGTGMGGCVVAGDLYDTNSRLGKNAKSVLVIEKGGLAFHSHCLNAARPSGFGEDRGQQNDTFFALFKDNYTFKHSEQSKEWKGGPMFNVGGRGAAWGLFCPRIHDETLEAKLGPDISKDLRNTWYTEAETLMSLSLPLTNTVHQNVMERLNIETKSKGCQWQWGRISSEFSESKNFDFALGAYSPIDKILEIAMSKDRDPTGASIEHLNWKILINTEVRRILWDNEKRATGVVVRDANGKETEIFLKKDHSGSPVVDTKIVLGAGSVGSPAILMRSGLKDELQNPDSNALHLTDHDIFAKGVTFSYDDLSISDKVGSMKLQSYIRLDSGKIALINFAINASSFLPREFLPSHHFTNRNFPKLIAAIILPTNLNSKNTIDLDANGEPVLTAHDLFLQLTYTVYLENQDEGYNAQLEVFQSPDRASLLSDMYYNKCTISNSNPEVQEIRDVTKSALMAVKDALKLQFLEADADGVYDWDDDNFFKPLELGGVAHELGTLPLKCYDSNKRFLLQPNLELVSRKGVYVCDLSVFPFSPEVNPTPTLVALALRLSRTTLLPRIPIITARADSIYVMNQSGENIKVNVSNLTGAVLNGEEIADNKEGGKILEPGDLIQRGRHVDQPNKPVAESVMVYSLQFNSQTEYLKKPVTYIASLGAICVIE